MAASIDYRLAGDEPLPSPRVKPFFDAVGGESSSARDRSVVASMEDTLTALDYLLSRADELNIDAVHPISFRKPVQAARSPIRARTQL